MEGTSSPSSSSRSRRRTDKGQEEENSLRKRRRKFKSRFGDASKVFPQPLDVDTVEDPAVKAARLHSLQQAIDVQIAFTKAALGEAHPNLAAGLGAVAAAKKARDFSLRLDDKGRELDEQGRVKPKVALSSTAHAPVVTLKANEQLKVDLLPPVNPYLAHVGDKPAVSSDAEDPSLISRSEKSRSIRQAFNFVKEGTYTKLADQEREKNLAREHARVMRGIGVATKSEIKEEEGPHQTVNYSVYGSSSSAIVSEKALPPPRDMLKGGVLIEIEWWDEALLPKEIRADKSAGKLPPSTCTTEALYSVCTLEACLTHKYIQHPPPSVGYGSPSLNNVAMPIYLTKRERKRVRRQNRFEKEQDKRDKIALGLMPPPAPKMKLSNFMAILGEKAVADPSKMENLVRAEVSDRYEKHLEHNASKKLTPEQRRAKSKAKYARDAERGLMGAVFRVADLSGPRQRFKVDINASQLHLTGTALICPAAGFHVVIVEGGHVAIKRYVKLMMRRIKWDEDEDEESGDDDSDVEDDEEMEKVVNVSSRAGCQLVWEGTIQRRNFHNFRFQECKGIDAARKLLGQRGITHYWDICEKSAVATNMDSY